MDEGVGGCRGGEGRAGGRWLGQHGMQHGSREDWEGMVKASKKPDKRTGGVWMFLGWC